MDSALKAGVKLAGVNVMAMDYGEYAAPTSGANAQTMGTYVIRSAQSTTQLSTMYAKYGQSYGWASWGSLRCSGERRRHRDFQVADARALEDFARTKGMGIISMWSLLHDNPGTLGRVSEAASGLSNPSNSFSDIFRDYGPITRRRGSPEPYYLAIGITSPKRRLDSDDHSPPVSVSPRHVVHPSNREGPHNSTAGGYREQLAVEGKLRPVSAGPRVTAADAFVEHVGEHLLR